MATLSTLQIATGWFCGSEIAAFSRNTEGGALRPGRSGISLPKRSGAGSLAARPLEKVAASRSSLVVRASAEGAAEEPIIDDRIGQYCDVGKKRTVGEMEQDFLLALQAFYIDAKPLMSNEEFDNLKQELQWEGSRVVMLSPEEQKFMQASLAYAEGKPFISDEEYNLLKAQLKKQGSKVAIEGPRCSIRTRRVFSDSSVDYLRMTLLQLPAALVALLLVFFVDDLTGFEITYLLELPEPWSFIFTWFVVLPVVYVTARQLTSFILKDFLILTGPCPSCGATNVSFFGEILTIQNSSRANDVKCEACGASLRFDLDTRRITLEPPPPPSETPKAPGKKPAVAAAKEA